MQQRRPRLGDILDDYCPRERRITNHAIVAMIDDEVKQTRCTTCDADHEYKHAKIPAPRRKKDDLDRPLDDVPQMDETPLDAESDSDSDLELTPSDTADVPAETEVHADAAGEGGSEVEGPREDDGPVHRRLIRATLPRPEGQSPERKEPEFTIRQPGGRGREFDGNRPGGGGGQRHGRGRRAMRSGGGPQGPSSGPSRFGGGPRHNSPQGPRQNGNRPGPSGSGGGGQRGGGRPQGQPRGGGGRKRGR